MSTENAENLKAHLKALHRSLEEAGQVDDELEMLLRQLDGDIERVLDQKADQQLDENTYGLASRAQALSARFAIRHPHLEPTLRELGNILATMGI
jgi:ABC-type transporter Mla subunit MlaD